MAFFAMKALRSAARQARNRVVPSRRRATAQWAARQRVQGELYARTEGKIAGGPFLGMRFVPEGSWGFVSPLLAGCYEAELFSTIEAFVSQEPRRVVVVGAAEGYYAVGLAMRLPNASVTAFDIDANSRKVCAAVAELNGVASRVTLRGECSHADLDRLVGSGCLAIVDCEGCELDLLDPSQVPSLAETSLIVELHDFVDSRIRPTIQSRFSASHSITIIQSSLRDPRSVAAVAGLQPADQFLAVDEMRPSHPHPMEWAVLVPVSHI